MGKDTVMDMVSSGNMWIFQAVLVTFLVNMVLYKYIKDGQQAVHVYYRIVK